MGRHWMERYRAMRMELTLPQVKPDEFKKRLVCAHVGCQGRHFEHHQEMDKPLKDTGYRTVSAHRYRCLRCNRTSWVNPVGVTRAQTSQRVKGLRVVVLAGAELWRYLTCPGGVGGVHEQEQCP